MYHRTQYQTRRWEFATETEYITILKKTTILHLRLSMILQEMMGSHTHRQYLNNYKLLFEA